MTTYLILVQKRKNNFSHPLPIPGAIPFSPPTVIYKYLKLLQIQFSSKICVRRFAERSFLAYRFFRPANRSDRIPRRTACWRCCCQSVRLKLLVCLSNCSFETFLFLVFCWLDFSTTWGTQAEAQTVVRVVRAATVAISRAAVPGVVDPATTPKHAIRACSRSSRISNASSWILSIPVLTPLIDITMHII